MPGPGTRLTLLPYLQGFDGDVLSVRVVALPGGSPLTPLAPASPGSLDFAGADLKLLALLTSGLEEMPPAGAATATAIPAPAPARAKQLFEALAATFPIDPSPPPAEPRRQMTVLKYLPRSYREASGVTRPVSPYALTDDCYACAHRRVAKPKQLPDRANPIPWGRVIAIALRQPLLAAALGLVREIEVPVAAGALEQGGWLHLTLAPGGDAGLLAAPGALGVFAARIPPLTTGATLFTPVLFPAPPGNDVSYDTAFVEAIEYADGFAKVVHTDQQRTADPLAEEDDGTRPARETGIRIGWDDEQIAVWINRQVQKLGFGDLDTQMGVAGYRIDCRRQGEGLWHSLCAVAGEVEIGGIDLGLFEGEQAVETQPVQLDAEAKGEFWLKAHFARWSGGAVVGNDSVGMQLSGAPRPAAGGVAAMPPPLGLTYGSTYEFRVRLADHAGGGPGPNAEPTVPGLAPSASHEFRRWVPPGKPELTPPDSPTATELLVRRPRLGYPAYPCTGTENAVADLLADLPQAQAEGRDPGLPDPDAVTARVDVKVRAPGFDPEAEGGFVTLYTSSRDLPKRKPLRLALEWRDVEDATTLADAGSGPLPLPTSREVRIEVRALCRPDSELAYFGADDVRLGPAAVVALRKEASDERGLLEVGPPADFLRALYLQPSPPTAPAQAAEVAAAAPPATGDPVARVAAILDLDHAGLTLRSRPGRRLVCGAAAGLRHVLGPDHGSITLTSAAELTRQWLVVVRARVKRDWSWDGLGADGIAVLRDGVEVGRLQPLPTLADEAEVAKAGRGGTDLLFVDVVDGKPPVGEHPRPLELDYVLVASYSGTPEKFDEPLAAGDLTLPVTTPPAQAPELISAGIALSPYEHSEDYSRTELRRRQLWLQFDVDPEDPDDALFARVLRAAPDPLLTGPRTWEVGDEPVEAPLPIDPEYSRVVVPGQSDDRAGLGSMQRLLPGDAPGHYLLPLPPGVHEDDPALFGFFTYELRCGHAEQWSTAQGRFGSPLRVAGIQHPPPELICSATRTEAGITVSAPFANPVHEGVSRRPARPLTRLCFLLYAQVERADRGGPQNVLLSHRLGAHDAPTAVATIALGTPNPSNDLADGTAWTQFEVAAALEGLGLPAEAPLSVLAVEIVPGAEAAADPLGSGLGSERILRSSPLVAIADLCVCDTPA